MKQLVQSLKNEGTILVDSDIPKVSDGKLLIRTVTSLISTGTEKMLVDFGAASYINKARQQPDKVKQVLQKIKTDGLMPTIEAVQNKLDMPIPLGYCNVGVVCEVGKGVKGFSSGDLVVSNGGHSEYILISQNLCAKIPEDVSTDDAVFTVLSSIALQGIRLSSPTIGETFVVMGLGLVGQLTVQLLIANGCKVIAFDLNKKRVDVAIESGAIGFVLTNELDSVSEAILISNGHGVDGVLITANTSSDLLIKQSANMCRKRGRIVLIGVTGLNISRDDFYEKEITFQVSSSYGPGRYESNYEEKGLDYPIGFVRWTEQRNFSAILQLVASKKFLPSNFITHRFDIEDASSEYNSFIGSEDALGILIDYKNKQEYMESIREISHPKISYDTNENDSIKNLTPLVGLLGSGEYARRVLIPNLKKEGMEIKSLASQHGLSGYFSAKKNKIPSSTTDYKKIILDPEINTVVISTRHNSHAELVIEALTNNKNVFVEKPLCISLNELEAIETCYSNLLSEGKEPKLMIGFNRRFSPHITRIHENIRQSSKPSSCIISVNAGKLDSDHWLNDPSIGGGRLIGEVCHFIDLAYFLLGGDVKEFHVSQMLDMTKDSISITMEFQNGSTGTIHYFCNGNKTFPKERIEVFNEGNIFQVNNFKNSKHFSQSGVKNIRSFSQDKGHNNCIKEFNKSLITNSDMPISHDDIFNISRIAIQASNKCGMS